MPIVLSSLQPKPPPNFPWVDRDGRPTHEFARYIEQLDAVIRLLISGQLELLPLVQPPSNANAAAAGVAVGRFYVDNAQRVYQRTA